MIAVNNVSKWYGDRQVLSDLSFTAPAGSVTGLVGPNGSGKSTTIRLISGLNDTDAGSIDICGRPMSVAAMATKRLIGYAAESAPSYFDHTAREYLYFIAKVRGIAQPEIAQEISRVAREFAIEPVLDKAIGTLSKGYRHRVCLAQAIVGDPPVIILDEPTDGLDPVQKIETRKVIAALATHKAVLLTTHLLEDVESLCDHIVMLDKGKVAYAGSKESVLQANAGSLVIDLQVVSTDPEQLQRHLARLACRSMSYSVTDAVPNTLGVQAYTVTASMVFDVNTGADPVGAVSLQLFDSGVRVVTLSQRVQGLSAVFEQLG